jgi:hypothetical protein
LTAALGAPPLRSANARYLFYDLRPYAARCLSAESAWSEPQRRSRYPVELTFERGFYDEDHDASHGWHWAGKHGRLVLVNPLNSRRNVLVSMLLRTGFDEPQNIRVSGPDRTDNLAVGRVWAWRRSIALPPLGQAALSFSCDCKRAYAPADPRQLYFVVDDLKVEDR